jgi:hypothetical protein
MTGRRRPVNETLVPAVVLTGEKPTRRPSNASARPQAVVVAAAGAKVGEAACIIPSPQYSVGAVSECASPWMSHGV